MLRFLRGFDGRLKYLPQFPAPREKIAPDGLQRRGNRLRARTTATACVQAYGMRDLVFGAGADQVKQVHRELAKDLHPDTWAAKSERGKGIAEEQLKGINAACDHLYPCRFARARSSAGDSQS